MRLYIVTLFLSLFTSSITPSTHPYILLHTHTSTPSRPAATCAPQWRTEWFGKWWPFITAWCHIPPPHSITHTPTHTLSSEATTGRQRGKCALLPADVTSTQMLNGTDEHCARVARPIIAVCLWEHAEAHVHTIWSDFCLHVPPIWKHTEQGGTLGMWWIVPFQRVFKRLSRV